MEAYFKDLLRLGHREKKEIESLGLPRWGWSHFLEHPPPSGASLWSIPAVVLCRLGLAAATQQAHDIINHEKKHPYSLSSESLIIDSFVGHTLSLATGGLAPRAVDNYSSLLRHPSAHGCAWEILAESQDSMR